MFKLWNPNPKFKLKKNGKIPAWNANDCTVRAVAYCVGCSWKEAYKLLSDEGLSMCEIMDNWCVVESVLKKYGFEKRTLPKGSKPTVERFATLHKDEICCIHTTGHVLVTADGCFHDCNDYAADSKVFSYLTKVK